MITKSEWLIEVRTNAKKSVYETAVAISKVVDWRRTGEFRPVDVDAPRATKFRHMDALRDQGYLAGNKVALPLVIKEERKVSNNVDKHAEADAMLTFFTEIVGVKALKTIHHFDMVALLEDFTAEEVQQTIRHYASITTFVDKSFAAFKRGFVELLQATKDKVIAEKASKFNAVLLEERLADDYLKSVNRTRKLINKDRIADGEEPLPAITELPVPKEPYTPTAEELAAFNAEWEAEAPMREAAKRKRQEEEDAFMAYCLSLDGDLSNGL